MWRDGRTLARVPSYKLTLWAFGSGELKNTDQLFFHEESIDIWNFKTLACTVHKIWHSSDFILIFSKGRNSRKGDNFKKKKKCVSAIFPWGIHIWNFKTLACRVLDKRMHGNTTWKQYAPSTSSELGHKKWHAWQRYQLWWKPACEIKSWKYYLHLIKETYDYFRLNTALHKEVKKLSYFIL